VARFDGVIEGWFVNLLDGENGSTYVRGFWIESGFIKSFSNFKKDPLADILLMD